MKQEAMQTKMAYDFINQIKQNPKLAKNMGLSAEGRVYYKPSDSLFDNLGDAPKKPSPLEGLLNFFKPKPTTVGPAPDVVTPGAGAQTTDVRNKAKTLLQQQGIDDTDSTVDQFLKRNPHFS